MTRKRISIFLTILCACVVFLFLFMKIEEVTSLKQKLEATELEFSLELEENYEHHRTLTQEISRLQEVQYELEASIEWYEENQKQTEQAIENGLTVIDGASMEELKRAGISDYNRITKDLRSKPELIPHDGVLGGTMFFYEAILLSNKWALGRFEDGHILGYGLYKYEIDEDGDITWEIIDSYIVGSE